MLQVLHNPRCGKSRDCLAFLENAKTEFEIKNYLQNPLSASELMELLTKLNLKPIELVRQKETLWIENFKGKTLTDEQIIKAMADFPILIERPIVIKDNKAIIGRDLEKLEKFL